ncbi:MAG: hypothetical protein IPJ65_03440 [Archangiaceae bacterium]|nr:hypothetical protein [Archangiaceae bacterium]
MVLFGGARALDEPDREWLLRVVTFGRAAALALIAVRRPGAAAAPVAAPGGLGAMLGQRNAVAHASPWRLLRRGGARRAPAASRRAATAALLAAARGGGGADACRASGLALPLVLAAWLVFTRGRGVVIAAVAAFGAALAALLPSRLAWSSATPLKSTLTRLVDADSGSGWAASPRWASAGPFARAPLLSQPRELDGGVHPRVSLRETPPFGKTWSSPPRRLLWRLVSVLVERGPPVAVRPRALAVAVAARLVQQLTRAHPGRRLGAGLGW